MKWWDRMPWSSYFEHWVLSQLFHSILSPSSRGFLVPLCFLPLGSYHLKHITWGFSFLSFFLSFFFCIDAKPHQVEQINYLMTTSKLPQTYWNLRLITLTTCDNTLFPHHHPIRELCTSCLLALGHLSLTLPLKTLFWTPGDPWIWVFWARAVLNSLLVALH